MAHECEICGQECYCDMEDHGGSPQPDDCVHLAEHEDGDDLCQRPAFQVCGHPLSEMYQDDDTTPYCTACVKELTR